MNLNTSKILVFENSATSSRIRLVFTLLITVLISACGSTDAPPPGDDLAEGMARLTISIPGLNPHQTAQKSTAVDKRVTARRDGVPAEVTSLLIEVLNEAAIILDSAEVIGTEGTVSLTIVEGENYTIRGRAFAGNELLFFGEAGLASVKAGTSTAVSLTLADQIQLDLTAFGDIETGVGATGINFTLAGLNDISINWYVNGVLGGNADSGLIDTSGRYTPPATLPLNPVIVITAEPAVAPSFAQSFSFSLLPADTVNNTPTADAGLDQSVNEQTTVTLNGSDSADSDGTISAFNWLQTAGAVVTLSDAGNASPQFTTPTLTNSEILTFELTVTDNEGAINSDSVSIAVQPVNIAPIADAGVDQTVNPAVVVNLSASASSDADGNITAYSWTRIAGDLTPVLLNASSENASFTSPSLQYGGFVTYRLRVTDNEAASSTDDITITVNGTDQPLVANAGPDQVVAENTLVTLNGSASNDPDNVITNYLWEELTNGGLVLSGSSATISTFTAPDVVTSTDFQFRLTVTNDNGDQVQDTTTVTVNNVLVTTNNVYFAASSGFGAQTIWVTDGTDAGTQQVAAVQTSNIALNESKTIAGSLYFAGNDGVNGTELWKTDGTLAGTEMFASADDLAYVGEGASASGDPGAFSVLGDKLLYRAVTSSVNGSNRVSEQLSLDTVNRTITPVSVAGTSSFSNIHVGTFNGLSYFYNKNSTPVISTILYKTDGVNAATIVKSFPQFDDIHDFTEANGELFFVLGSRELWKTDGTDAGTIQVKIFTGFVGEVGNFTGQKNMIAFNSRLIFVADDGEGRELWGSDGSVAGTVLIKDLDASIASSNPTEFNIVNGRLVFLSSEGGPATDGVWETDGTAIGTQRIFNLQVNTDIGFYDGVSTGVSIVVDSLNMMFFTANDGVNGNELWVTDGTSLGTRLVRDINSLDNSEPAMFREGNGFLIFSAQDEDFRAKLWRSDGTESGTTLIQDVNPGGFGNSAFFFVSG
jgi:ELWxxDGT repeat protein